MKIREIKKLSKGDTFEGHYAITDTSLRKSKNGKDFLACKLVDATGEIQAKVWDFIGKVPSSGEVWKTTCQYSPFAGRPQVVIRNRKVVPVEEVDKSLMIDSLTPEQFRLYNNRLESLIKRIKNDGLRFLVDSIVHKVYPEYLTCTGAKSNHHARIGGLLQHSVDVTTMALGMAEAYRDMPKYEMINFDMLIAGGLLHDLGKIREYTDESNTLEFTFEGSLLRSYNTSPQYLIMAWKDLGEPVPYESLLGIIHIMVTHHGPELSAVPPSTITAWLIHGADLADCFAEAVADKISEGTDERGVAIEKAWIIKNKIVDERKL